MEEPTKEIDVIFVGQTGVGKSTLINMIMGVPDGSSGAAKVSNGARPCTEHTTSYSASLEGGVRCRLWDTRGLDETAGINDRGRLMGNIKDIVRQLASQQARELKETLRNRTRLATPILVWCMDATKINVDVHWQQFCEVYMEYCERKAIPLIVINRGPPKRTGWEARCTDQLQSLGLDVEVPFRMVSLRRGTGRPTWRTRRRFRSPSFREYGDDSQTVEDFKDLKDLRDLISKLAGR